MKRPLLASLVYGAVPVGLYFIYRQGWLDIPSTLNTLPAAVAVVLVVTGFAFNVAGWRSTLAMFGYSVGWHEATAALGLSVMGKYLPGKVWALVGRASYSALRHDWPLARLSFVSLYAQFVNLWLGLALGLAGVALIGIPVLWLYGILPVLALLTAILFTPPGQRWTERLLNRISRHTATTAPVRAGGLALVLIWFLLAWLAWAAGFVVFAHAFPGVSVSPAAGLGFVLAGVVGILTIFAPGGIGTRETALVAFLLLGGVGVAQATAVAVGSRVWFLTGELGLFVAGLIADRLCARSRRISAAVDQEPLDHIGGGIKR